MPRKIDGSHASGALRLRPLHRPRQLRPVGGRSEAPVTLSPPAVAVSAAQRLLRQTAGRVPCDRRRTPRKMRSDLCASLDVPGMRGGDQAFGIVMDLSDHGMCIRTPQPPMCGRSVLVRIAVRDEVLVLTMLVRRAHEVRRGIYDVGLELRGYSDDQLMLLHRVLAHD